MPESAVTAVSALAGALASDPGRPLVTFYDPATGERVELSVKTFDNWVNKIANLFTDGLMLDAGEVVRVDLPTHWQSTVTLLAAWTAGLQVSLVDGSPDGAESAASNDLADVAVSVVGPAALSRPGKVPGQPLACSLRPLGGPFADELPPGWLDFGREVPAQPDALVAKSSAGPADIAVHTSSGQLTHREIVDEALRAASDLGIAAGGRLLTDANPCRADGLAAALLAPLVTGSSVVLVAGGGPATVASIADQERVTSSVWVTG